MIRDIGDDHHCFWEKDAAGVWKERLKNPSLSRCVSEVTFSLERESVGHVNFALERGSVGHVPVSSLERGSVRHGWCAVL
mmetsp:Transcript_18281/g.24752  ORF Transcript_18281/g.24752 Transcript_18281/m.24752 type:complete len:80 (+) Transcript_18281:667-906(+)